MKVLLDECIDQRLRLSFCGHECETARFAGLAGLKNGDLLDAAEAAGFAVLITVDQHSSPSKIPDQQNLRGRKMSILILRRDEQITRPATSCSFGQACAGQRPSYGSSPSELETVLGVLLKHSIATHL